MSKEIKEKKEPKRYPKFKEARNQFSVDEILRLAEAGYVTEVIRQGGVIE